MLYFNLFYLSILAFTAVLWFIPIFSISAALIGIVGERVFGVPMYNLKRAVTVTYWWPFVGVTGSLAILGAWWSLSWW